MTYRLPDASGVSEEGLSRGDRDATTYRLPNGRSLRFLYEDRQNYASVLAAADKALCDAVVFAHEHDGLSWAQIGDAIGIDRWAARWFAQKHTARVDGDQP